MEDFLPQRGDYRKLRCFLLAENIYDLTFIFTQKFLPRGDRTIDQMLQAARSGKQNIAEGSAAATTSTKTEIHLTNVAKASLQELLLDYEDYLTVRQLEIWQLGNPKLNQTRSVLRENHLREFYLEKSQRWDATTMANVVITMIHQCDYLLARLIKSQKERFLRDGGITEAMSKARREYRNNQSTQRYQSTQNHQSSPSTQSSQRYPSTPSSQSSQSSQSTQSTLSSQSTPSNNH